jgi:23S rRNA pseudouridine1911/1915/1917 synthase
VAREKHKPGAVWLGVVHRIDRPISGVVLFARTSKAAARLSSQFRERGVVKRYLAVGEGRVEGRAGELRQWLVKDQAARRVRAAARASPGAREAVTRWRVLAERDGRTLLALEPLTGRPHQLRLAAATLGAPLSGDVKYGAPAPLPDRSVALHALSLEVEHPTLATRVGATCAPRGEVWEPFRGDWSEGG